MTNRRNDALWLQLIAVEFAAIGVIVAWYEFELETAIFSYHLEYFGRGVAIMCWVIALFLTLSAAALAIALGNKVRATRATLVTSAALSLALGYLILQLASAAR